MSDRTGDPLLDMIGAAVDAELDADVERWGHITLGELAARLEAFPDDAPVMLSTGTPPGHYDSYRGYYRFIAIEPGGKPTTCAEFHKRTTAAIGETFEGYKGGDFTMTRRTPVWVSPYGSCTGEGVVGVELQDGTVTLLVEVLDR